MLGEERFSMDGRGESLIGCMTTDTSPSTLCASDSLSVGSGHRCTSHRGLAGGAVPAGLRAERLVHRASAQVPGAGVPGQDPCAHGVWPRGRGAIVRPASPTLFHLFGSSEQPL